MLPSVPMARVKHPTLRVPLIFASGIQLPFFFRLSRFMTQTRAVRLHGSLTTNRIGLVERLLTLHNSKSG
jgi:hypothetical protein